MANFKNLKTRIVLTHDDYADLKGKHLKEGEVVLAKVGETTDGNVTYPVFMMKVGTAETTKTVAELPWLMAPAADVHGWAKKQKLDVADVPTLPISKIEGLQDALDALTAEDLRLAGLIGGLRTDVDSVRSDFDAHNHDSQYKKIQEAVAEKGAADKTLKISQDAQGVITTEEVSIQIAQSQVTGLTDALAGKSNEGHKHVKADITDFAHTHTKSEITDFEHNHRANTLESFSDDVKAVVNTMGLGTDDTIKALSDRMDTAEADIDALEGAVATKVESETYETKVAALEKADTDEAAARELLAGRVSTLEADATTKTYVDTELAKKADKATYEAKVAELEAKDSALTTAVEAAQADADEANRKIDAFMGTIEAGGDAIDTLQEVLDLIKDGDDVATGLLTDVSNLKAADVTLQANIDKKANQTDLDALSVKVGHESHTEMTDCDGEITFPATGIYAKIDESVERLSDSIGYVSTGFNESCDTYGIYSYINSADEKLSLQIDDARDRLGRIENNAVLSIGVNTGLKIAYESCDVNYQRPVIGIDEAVVFVLDGGDASNLD